MFGNKKIMELEKEIYKLGIQISIGEKERELAVEKAKNEIRLEMRKQLVESDMKRAKAEATVQALKTHVSVDLDTVTRLIEKLLSNLPKVNSETKIVK